MAKNQHVVPNPDGGWDVKGEGASRATRHVPKQCEAIEIARNIARNQRSELIMHGRDGKIRGQDSYGGAPYPPNG